MQLLVQTLITWSIWNETNFSLSSFACLHKSAIFGFLVFHRPWICYMKISHQKYKQMLHDQTSKIQNIIGSEKEKTANWVSSICPLQTCMHTSLESPWTRMCLYPSLRACFNPKSTARYSATLFVAIPTPSRNQHTYQNSGLLRAKLCEGDNNQYHI